MCPLFWTAAIRGYLHQVESAGVDRTNLLLHVTNAVLGSENQRLEAQARVSELLGQHEDLQDGFETFLSHVRAYPPGVFGLGSLMEDAAQPPSRITNEADASSAGALHDESLVSDEASLSLIRVESLESTSDPSTSHSLTYSHTTSTSASTAYSGQRVTERNVVADMFRGRNLPAELVGLAYLDLAGIVTDASPTVPDVSAGTGLVPDGLPALVPVQNIPLILAAPGGLLVMQPPAAEPRSFAMNAGENDDGSDHGATLPADPHVPPPNSWWMHLKECLNECFRFCLPF